mgnify:CR=1 FL=1
MNCPECASEIQPDQNYCRDCGLELIPRPRSRFREMGVALLALMFVGLMVAIFGKMFEMRPLAYLGLAVLLTGAFIFAVYGFFPETRAEKRSMRKPVAPTPQVSVEKADTTNKLLPVGENDFIPSVVENSTELLKNSSKRERI